MAQDKGFPPLSRTVDIEIDVVDRANNPPVWTQSIYGPIYIKENLPVGAGVISVKARCVIHRTRQHDLHVYAHQLATQLVHLATLSVHRLRAHGYTVGAPGNTVGVRLACTWQHCRCNACVHLATQSVHHLRALGNTKLPLSNGNFSDGGGRNLITGGIIVFCCS